MNNGHDLNECFANKLVSGYPLQCMVSRSTLYPTYLPPQNTKYIIKLNRSTFIALSASLVPGIHICVSAFWFIAIRLNNWSCYFYTF